MAFVGKVLADEVEGSIGSTLFGTCTDPASTINKNVTVPGLDALIPGLTIHVMFANSNTAADPTITIQGTGVSQTPLYRYGAVTPGATYQSSWPAGAVVSMTYVQLGQESFVWILNDWLNTDENTTYEDATHSTHGLMPAADKTRFDGFDVKAFSSITIASTAWTADNTYTDYGFKATFTCTGITSDYVPAVTFLPADLEAYYIAPVALSGTDSVTVYCGIKPTGNVTVQSVTAVKYSAGGA